jgi:hypothetical protein
VCLVVLYKPLLSPEVVGKEYPWTVRRTRARKIRVGGCNDQRLKKKKKKRKEKRRRRTQDHDYSRTHNCFPWSMDMDVGPSDEEDRRWEEEPPATSGTDHTQLR